MIVNALVRMFMDFSFLVVTPPLVVIAVVLLTRRMIVSFIVGIIWAALLATKGNVIESATLIGKRFLTSAGVTGLSSWQGILDNSNLAIFIFLCSLGTIIALLQRTGAAMAYGRFIKKFVHTRQQVEISSLILSFFFFIDDYFSALTVGSVMRPFAALYNLSPLKLAFLVTAMASPIAILAPISSWVGEVVLQLRTSGITMNGQGVVIAADPFNVFLQTIPFVFYAIILIVATWYIVLRKISYGPMAHHEQCDPAIKVVEQPNNEHCPCSIVDFIFPLTMLVSTIFIMLLFTGGYHLLGGTNDFFGALKSGVVYQSLLVGGLVGVIATSIFFLVQKKISIDGVLKALKEGAWLMIPSIIMLIHAWTLGSILKSDLHTGDFVAQWFGMCVCIPIFPALCFVITALISSLIGSAWAAIGLMFPIIIPMLQTLTGLASGSPIDAVPLLVPIIGATLSGSIMGTHLSLIADNPIMSAASTGANHLEHIKTMSWYVLPVGIATVVSYLIIGYTCCGYGFALRLALALLGGIGTALVLLEMGQWFFGKKS